MERVFVAGTLLVLMLTVGGSVSAANLVVNGGFEAPVVSGFSWNIFPSGTPSLVWDVTWEGGSSSFGGATRPAIANLELQKAGTVSGVSPFEGAQYAELDTDWDGPSGSLSGEPANVRITQTIPTVAGKPYVISWQDRCRVSGCSLGLVWDGADIGSTFSPLTNSWTGRTFYPDPASGAQAVVGFFDKGTPDSIGALIDDVAVRSASIDLTVSCPLSSSTTAPVFTYEVTNDGDLALEDVTINDGQIPALSPLDDNGDGILSGGETWHYQRASGSGLVPYDVTATGRYSPASLGLYVSDSDSGTCGSTPVPEFPAGIIPAFIIGLAGIVLYLKESR